MTVVSKASIFKFILDFLYGNFCPCCGRAVKWNMLICDDCDKKLENIRAKACKICGHINCEDHKTLQYDNAVTLFVYKDICKESIYKLKSSGEYNFAEYSALKLCERITENFFDEKIDIVTAVPMSRKSRLSRGYNHAEILGKYISRRLKKPYNFKLLNRKNDNAAQHHLSSEERKSHAESIYSARKKHKDINGKTVLLVDDVLTTGSTMNSCARLLKQMGVKKVICAAIAVTELKK